MTCLDDYRDCQNPKGLLIIIMSITGKFSQHSLELVRLGGFNLDIDTSMHQQQFQDIPFNPPSPFHLQSSFHSFRPLFPFTFIVQPSIGFHPKKVPYVLCVVNGSRT